MAGSEPGQILIVNDRVEDLTALVAALEPMNESLLTASSARDALRLAREAEIAVAILDVSMPEIDGFQLAEQLRRDVRTHDLPILFVSALDPTPEILDRVYSLGAVDFISTPVVPKALRPKVAVFVELHRKSTALARLAQQVARKVKAAEHDLAENREELQLAIEAAELGTFLNDLSTGRILHNERANQLLGLPPAANITTETFLSTVHPDDRARVASTLAERRTFDETRGNLKLEYRVVWPDQSIHHLASASRAVVEHRADGTNVVRIIGTLRDVTATKEFEQELKNKVVERTAALEEKTAQLESFCYTVAHDLRSPLRAISGYADIVGQDYGAELSATGNDYIAKIKNAAARLDSLIKDLLAYSRITQIDLVLDDTAPEQSVDWALQQLQPEIAAKAAQIDVARPLPPVRGERSILDQVLLNLLSNALKFVPNGTIPHVQISADRRDGIVRLAVRDNGIGIPDAYHERIFRVFERLQQARDFPGTGVGLAIVAKAAERLGGTVGVASTPGLGSTFWIELKAAKP